MHETATAKLYVKQEQPQFGEMNAETATAKLNVKREQPQFGEMNAGTASAKLNVKREQPQFGEMRGMKQPCSEMRWTYGNSPGEMRVLPHHGKQRPKTVTARTPDICRWN
jgi:hypothetical protein